MELLNFIIGGLFGVIITIYFMSKSFRDVEKYNDELYRQNNELNEDIISLIKEHGKLCNHLENALSYACKKLSENVFIDGEKYGNEYDWKEKALRNAGKSLEE